MSHSAARIPLPSYGPSRCKSTSDSMPAIGGLPDVLVIIASNAVDPNVWSGRALQEDSSIWRLAVLHQCIRPLIGAFAPGHHGDQRACDLISGQASSGPFGSPVFARAGKTDPPSLRFLSQTSVSKQTELPLRAFFSSLSSFVRARGPFL